MQSVWVREFRRSIDETFSPHQCTDPPSGDHPITQRGAFDGCVNESSKTLAGD